MKFLRIVPLVLVTIFASCTSDNGEIVVNELDGLTKIQEITNDTDAIEIYYNTITHKMDDTKRPSVLFTWTCRVGAILLGFIPN